MAAKTKTLKGGMNLEKTSTSCKDVLNQCDAFQRKSVDVGRKLNSFLLDNRKSGKNVFQPIESGDEDTDKSNPGTPIASKRSDVVGSLEPKIKQSVTNHSITPNSPNKLTELEKRMNRVTASQKLFKSNTSSLSSTQNILQPPPPSESATNTPKQLKSREGHKHKSSSAINVKKSGVLPIASTKTTTLRKSLNDSNSKILSKPSINTSRSSTAKSDETKPRLKKDKINSSLHRGVLKASKTKSLKRSSLSLHRSIPGTKEKLSKPKLLTVTDPSKTSTISSRLSKSSSKKKISKLGIFDSKGKPIKSKIGSLPKVKKHSKRITKVPSTV